jgi:hypothetical protein
MQTVVRRLMEDTEFERTTPKEKLARLAGSQRK